MKKYLLSISIIIVLLLSSFIFLPYIFKDKIISSIKKEANTHLSADLDFSNDIGINVFRSFPDLNLSLKNLTLRNADSIFNQDTLASIDRFDISFDLMEFYKEGEYVLKTLSLVYPKIYLESNDSASNWDIMKTSEAAEESTPVQFQLNDMQISDGVFQYRDGLTKVRITDIHHNSSGIYDSKLFNLDAFTTAKRVQVIYDDITYLDNWEMKQGGKIIVDVDQNIYTFPQNDFLINGLPTQLDGTIAYSESNLLFDLMANSSSPDINQILTLIPAIYTSDFSTMQTSGAAAFKAKLKGKCNETSFPSYSLKLRMENGSFKYPDLEIPADNINLDLNIYSVSGDFDNTIIDIPTFSFNAAEDQFKGKLKFSDIVNNPNLDITAHGIIDLGNLQKIIPLEEMQIQGKIKADLDMVGRLKDIKSSSLDRFNAHGDISTENFRYKTENMEEELFLSKGHLSIFNEKVTIDKLEGKLGQNSINIYAKFNNFFSYLSDDQSLLGNLVFRSSNFNLNDFYAVESKEGSKENELTLVEIPGNVELNISATIEKLIYDDLAFDNFSGDFNVKDNKFIIKDLASTFLGGALNFSGLYAYDPSEPSAQFNIKYSNIDLSQLPERFKVFSAFVPLAKKVKATSSASLQFSSELNKDMSPKMGLLNLGGAIDLSNIAIDDVKILQALDSQLGTSHFDISSLQDLFLNFQISDGKLLVNPFQIKIDESILRLEGTTKLDKAIDYCGVLSIPSTYVKKETQIINNLIKESPIQNLEIKPNEYLDLTVNITGSFSNPTVKVKLQEVKKSIGNRIQDTVSNLVNEKKQELKNELDEETKKIKKEAERKLDETKSQVEDEIKKRREAAEEKLRQEAEERRRKLKEEADKKLREIFKP